MEFFNSETFENPKTGISTIRAGGFMYGLIGLISLGIINFFSGIFQIEIDIKLYHLPILFIITLYINHILLFKKNKYLKYFKEFDNMSKKSKQLWACITFLIVLFIFAFLIASFTYMGNRTRHLLKKNNNYYQIKQTYSVPGDPILEKYGIRGINLDNQSATYPQL